MILTIKEKDINDIIFNLLESWFLLSNDNDFPKFKQYGKYGYYIHFNETNYLIQCDYDKSIIKCFYDVKLTNGSYALKVIDNNHFDFKYIEEEWFKTIQPKLMKLKNIS